VVEKRCHHRYWSTRTLECNGCYTRVIPDCVITLTHADHCGSRSTCNICMSPSVLAWEAKRR
jgi:hypothetical protein